MAATQWNAHEKRITDTVFQSIDLILGKVCFSVSGECDEKRTHNDKTKCKNKKPHVAWRNERRTAPHKWTVDRELRFRKQWRQRIRGIKVSS